MNDQASKSGWMAESSSSNVADLRMGRRDRTVLGILLVAATACRSEPAEDAAATNGPIFDAPVLEVVASAPRDAAGDIWLLVAGDGEIVQAARSERSLMATLLAEVPETNAVDVLVHVPDDAGWTPAAPSGEGSYASLTGIDASSSSSLTVASWARATTWNGETLGDVATPGEEAWGVLRGTVVAEDDSVDLASPPHASAVARAQIVRARHVATLLHETAHLDRAPSHILRLLDGRRSEAEIVDALADLVEAGQLDLTRDDQPIRDWEQMREPLAAVLHSTLPAFARRGLLVSEETDESA